MQPIIPPDDEEHDEEEENGDVGSEDAVIMINGGKIEAREIRDSPDKHTIQGGRKN